MDNIYYKVWKQDVLNYLTYIGINYGMIGDTISSIDDYGRHIRSINLIDAWLKHLSFIDIIDVLEPMTRS